MACWPWWGPLGRLPLPGLGEAPGDPAGPDSHQVLRAGPSPVAFEGHHRWGLEKYSPSWREAKGHLKDIVCFLLGNDRIERT